MPKRAAVCKHCRSLCVFVVFVCISSFCTERTPLASQIITHLHTQDPTWRKLCFCGFREDVAHLPQDERDKKPGMWPGACPPKICRTRKVGLL